VYDLLFPEMANFNLARTTSTTQALTKRAYTASQPVVLAKFLDDPICANWKDPD